MVLAEKRSFLAAANLAGLAELQPRQDPLIDPLQQCQHRRTAILSEANSNGLPHDSLVERTAALPAAKRQQWQPQIREAAARRGCYSIKV